MGQLVHRINARRFGVRARATQNGLLLTTRQRGNGAYLRIVTEPGGSRPAGTQVTGLNQAQIDAVDISGIGSGPELTIHGSRDSVAAAAQLTYVGSAGGLVSGSATFRISGSLGAADLSAIEGESLADFAVRINDASSSTGVIAEVVGNTVQISSTLFGDNATVVIDNVVRDSEQSVDGVNNSQLVDFELLSIAYGTSVTLTGTGTQTADSARLTYHGDTGGSVLDSATFTLSGALGSVEISILQGESLSDVEQTVNDVSGMTGVQAIANGNDLLFRSTEFGSAESINVTINDVTARSTVSGINQSQVSDFQVVGTTADTTDVLNATVTQSATQGQLSYNGFLGSTTNAANFTLTGQRGNAIIDISPLESLTSVRDKINGESANTGVTASTNGDVLTLKSSGTGSEGIVQVAVNSGTFATNGGDGNGNASGADALLDINGDTVSATANQVSYTDSLGSYTFTIADGLSGSIDPITISSLSGSFDLSGGDPSGTAIGVDAEMTINGQTLVGDGNAFRTTLNGAEFQFSVVQGFLGPIDPIVLQSTPDDFTLNGGDGNGADNGVDGTATLNGQLYSSANDHFKIGTDRGNLTIDFAAGFLGAIDDFVVSDRSVVGNRSFARSHYSAVGADAALELNGQRLSPTDGQYIVARNGVKVALKFADGFSGEFDTFQIRAGGEIDVAKTELTLADSDVRALGEILSELFTLATGGENAGLGENASRALAIATDTVSRIRQATGSAIYERRSLLGSAFDRIG